MRIGIAIDRDRGRRPVPAKARAGMPALHNHTIVFAQQGRRGIFSLRMR
jgi:hypothetical protein